ncbi:hypothetical protein ACVWWL_000503 [Bradyrhizobium sp. USDA 3696]
MRRLSRMRRGRTVDMCVGVIVSMRMPVVMGMAMSMIAMMGLGRGGNHSWMLYYNITAVHAVAQGLPISMAMAAATNGNGTETAQRNQTKRAGMNGISHKITRWKANSAQATT